MVRRGVVVVIAARSTLAMRYVGSMRSAQHAGWGRQGDLWGARCMSILRLNKVKWIQIISVTGIDTVLVDLVNSIRVVVGHSLNCTAQHGKSWVGGWTLSLNEMKCIKVKWTVE